MATYGQFCPIAKAMEILDERWTILIVRELLLGSTRFNELRRGVPRMSSSLPFPRIRASTSYAARFSQASAARSKRFRH